MHSSRCFREKPAAARWPRILAVAISTCLLVVETSHSRPIRQVRNPESAAAELVNTIPVYDQKLIDVGEFAALFWNRTGEIRGLEYPKGTGLQYLTVWPFFGCIRGVDTLVSSSGEFTPYSLIQEYSNRHDRSTFNPEASAEQQYTCVSSDTTILSYLPPDEIDLRLHKPIGIEVHATTYAWSDPYSKQFVLLDYHFKNISGRLLSRPCAGVLLSPQTQYWGCSPPPFVLLCDKYSGDNGDDMCGFFPTVAGVIPGEADSIGLFWAADNDGDPEGNVFSSLSPTGVAGARVLRVSPSAPISFNWWGREPRFPFPLHQTWGPRLAADRVFYRGSQGRPVGDRGLYHLATNGEVDYDQAYMAINHEADG